MTQIAIIQPTPQPLPPGGTPASDNPGEFTSHLSKAVEEITQTSQKENNSHDDNSAQAETSQKFTETGIATKAETEVVDETFFEKILPIELQDSKGLENLMTVETINGLNIPTILRDSIQGQNNSNIEVPQSQVSIKLPLAATAKELAIPQIVTDSSKPQTQPAAGTTVTTATTATTGNIVQEFTNSQINTQTDNSLKLDIKVDGSIPTVQTSNKNETVLQQLQKIIAQSNETGTVLIQGTVNKNSLAPATPGSEILTSQISATIAEPMRSAEKPATKLAPLRQDVNGQFFDAKLNSKNQTANLGQNTQTNNQQNGNGDGAQQQSIPLQDNPTLSTEQNTFSHFSTAAQEKQIMDPVNPVRPVALPSGTVVYEEDVMQQVMERFQITKKMHETRLSLKLHPAELGELKIDLTVKDGSIRANIVAQSQHVQEIVERNLAKLRNIIEEQGYSIEEILVTSESDSVTDFSLFQQQLSHQDNTSPQTGKRSQQADFTLALDDAVEETETTSTSGVNVKA